VVGIIVIVIAVCCHDYFVWSIHYHRIFK
jgi:hypothetical protein